MAINGTDARRPAAYLASSLIAALTLVCSAAQAEREFTPAIAAELSHTDNVALASENEQDETVLGVRPGFTFTQDSGRLSSSAVYQLDGYYYRDRQESEVYHRLDGHLRSELDRDNFFIDLGAGRSQSIRDPRAAIPRGNLYVSSNRINRDEAYIGPTLQYRLGGDAMFSGSYRRSWIGYDDDEDDGRIFSSNFTEDTVQVAVDNYRRTRGFTWAVRYESEETDYNLPMNWEYRRAALELGTWVGPTLRLFATGGMESDWEQPIDARLEDEFWEAGFEKRIGRRLTALAAAGERVFGSSRRASLSFSSRRLGTSLNYTEQPKTQERRRLGRDQLLGEQPEDFLVRPGTAERYLSERLDWDLTLALRRTDVLLRAVDETRKLRAGIDGAPLGDESQQGVQLETITQVGTRTDYLLNLHAARVEFGDGEERDIRVLSTGVRYNLSSRTQVSLTYEYLKETAKGEGSLSSGYRANLIQVLLRRAF